MNSQQRICIRIARIMKAIAIGILVAITGPWVPGVQASDLPSPPPASAGPANRIRVSLRVSGLPSPNATDPIGIADLTVLQEFLRTHLHIDLRPAEGIQLENMVSEVTTVMMVAGGIAPDVIKMNFRSTDTFVSKGMIAPLEEFLDREPTAVRGEILSRIPSQVMPVVDRVGPDGSRHIYGLRKTPALRSSRPTNTPGLSSPVKTKCFAPPRCGLSKRECWKFGLTRSPRR